MPTCDTCFQPLPKRTGRGRPARFCSKACRDLTSAIERLERELERTAEALPAGAQVELRYRMLTLTADEIPRPRYPKGHERAGQFMARQV